MSITGVLTRDRAASTRPNPTEDTGPSIPQRPPATARRTRPNPRSSRAVVTESSLTLPRVGPQVACHFCHFFHISSRDVFLFSILLLLSFLGILSSLLSLYCSCFHLISPSCISRASKLWLLALHICVFSSQRR